MNYNTSPRFANILLLSFALKYKSQINIALISWKTNNLMFKNKIIKSYFHNSSRLNSDIPKPQPKGESINPQPTIFDYSGVSTPELSNIDRLEIERNERESKLQLERYKPKSKEEESTLEEWINDTPTIDIPKELRDEFGLRLECTHPIGMFDGVRIISRYLELKHHIDPELISETKLTEILKIFDKSKGTITAEDLFEHMNNLFEKDKEFYIEKLKTETNNLSEKLISEDSKPFGQYGEVTLNQIGITLKENLKHLNDIRWDLVYENTKLTVHAAPTVVSAVSYGLLLKNYLKYVHNRPFEAGLSKSELDIQKIGRKRQLGFFCVLGAPLVMLLIRSTSISFKDMLTLTIGGDSQAANNSSNTVNSIIFFSYLNKKIPNWLKISFQILIVTLIVLKLLGFSLGSAFLSVLSINVYYIKVAYYSIFSLRICYNLLNLYLLHKFSNKSIKILEVLPEFLIKRLKEIETMSKTKAGIKEFKTSFYLDISVFLILMSITIIITYLF